MTYVRFLSKFIVFVQKKSAQSILYFLHIRLKEKKGREFRSHILFLADKLLLLYSILKSMFKVIYIINIYNNGKL